jgi:hypothetical protein
MSSRIRSHLRSNVVGYIALFVALRGTAVVSMIVTGDSDAEPKDPRGAATASQRGPGGQSDQDPNDCDGACARDAS